MSKTTRERIIEIRTGTHGRGACMTTSDVVEVLAMLRLYEVFDDAPLTPLNCRRSWLWEPGSEDERALCFEDYASLLNMLRTEHLVECARARVDRGEAMSGDRHPDYYALPALGQHVVMGAQFKYVEDVLLGDIVIETGCGEVIGFEEVEEEEDHKRILFTYDRFMDWHLRRIVEVL